MNEQLMKLAIIVNLHFEKITQIPYYLPIKTIDGIKVNPYIYVSEYCVTFGIESNGANCPNEHEADEERLFSHGILNNKEKCPAENTYNALLKIKEIIPTLRFDKFNSQFKMHEVSDTSKLFDELITADNVVKDYAECCVCYENTKREMLCGHVLCIPCHVNINSNEEGEKFCPVCREQI